LEEVQLQNSVMQHKNIQKKKQAKQTIFCPTTFIQQQKKKHLKNKKKKRV